MVVDDVVHLLRDDQGILRASVDVEDELVRSWATETIEEYWTRGEPSRATRSNLSESR